MKVSVIIPCYNVGEYISDCIKSVENQLLKDIEIICVNDGSSDNSVQVIESLMVESTIPIKLINQENNGASSARNHGLKYVVGDYIQFLDADDLLTKEKLSHQLQLAEENDFPDVIIGSDKCENFKEKFLFDRVYDSTSEINLWLSLMRTDLGSTCSNLYNKNLFSNGVKWNESLGSSQDYELMFQILKQSDRLAFDSEIHTVIRVRESGSISKTNIDKKWERYVQLRVDIVNYLKENSPEKLNNKFYQLLFDAIRSLYPHNTELALGFYSNNIPSDFSPNKSEITGKAYLLIYKILGFKYTEKIRLKFSSNKAN